MEDSVKSPQEAAATAIGEATERWAELMRELAHDIRTPLGIIHTVLSDLKAGHVVEGEDLNSAGEAVKRIKLQIDRLKPLLAIKRVNFQEIASQDLAATFESCKVNLSPEGRSYLISVEILRNIISFIENYYPDSEITLQATDRLEVSFASNLSRVDAIFIPLLLRAAGVTPFTE